MLGYKDKVVAVTGAATGNDFIRGDDGNDTILGDHGVITQLTNVRRIFSTAGRVRRPVKTAHTFSPDAVAAPAKKLENKQGK